MTQGPDDTNPEDGKILSPEELDISEDEHVTQIDEGRYVVSSEVRADEPPVSSVAEDPDRDDAQQAPQEAAAPEFTDSNVHEWLAEQLEESNARYGFDVTAKFDGGVDQQQLVSNDIVTVFESLLLWYARQLDGSTPVEDVLGILISQSNVPVRYPSSSIRELVGSTTLSPDDSIADLLEAVDERDGLEL